MNILTLNKKITDRERQSFWLALILFNFCIQSLATINSVLLVFISPIFYLAVNVLALGICLRKEAYERKNVYLLGLCFIAWYIVCWVVNRDFSCFQETELNLITIPLSAWGLALPFVTVTGDFDKKRALTVILSAVTLVLAIVVWAALIPTFLGTSFSLPGVNGIFGILHSLESEWRMSTIYTYPVIFGKHYYFTAYLSVLGFFTALYLFVRKKMRPIMPVAMIGFVTALALTRCRLALLGLGLGLFTAGFFLFRSKSRGACVKKTVLAGVVIALAVALCLWLIWSLGSFAGKLIPVEDDNAKPFTANVFSENTRLELWGHIPDMLKRCAPLSYLSGINESSLFALLYGLYRKYHIHSGYFSALMLMGIPGFLMVLVFLFKTLRELLYIFLKMKTHRIPLDIIPLLSIPVSFLFITVGEPLLFVGYLLKTIPVVFCLVCGYLFELADRIRKEELPPRADEA